MSRASEMEKRKIQIIDAAMDVLYEQGFCDLKISEVARRAGVSAGLVCHHFETKRGLLLAVMRQAVDAYQNQSEKVALAHPDLPDRTLALVQMALSPEQVNPRLSSAWLALYYLAASDPEYHAELVRYQNYNHSNILAALTEVFDPDDAKQKAHLISALIDGVWLQNAARCETVDIEVAQKLAVNLTKNVFLEKMAPLQS